MSLQNLILSIFPLSLGAAVSPTVLAVAMVILSSSNYPKKRIIAFLIGAAFVTITIGILEIMATGELIPSGDSEHLPISSYIDLGLGMLLLFLGLKKIFKPGEHKRNYFAGISTTPQIKKFLLTGALAMATNFSTFIFYLAALKTISLDTNSFTNQLLALIFINFFILLPITVPLFITIVAPKSSGAILERANTLLKKHGNTVTIAVLLIIGAYLMLKALKVLL